MGVKGRKLKHYSDDFKHSAVEEVLTNHRVATWEAITHDIDKS